MRPIDADALKVVPNVRKVTEYDETGCGLDYLAIPVDVIEAAPILDVAPAVHAYWIKTFNSDGFVSTLRCSECGNSENSTYIHGNFCWFCGARMDGDRE